MRVIFFVLGFIMGIQARAGCPKFTGDYRRPYPDSRILQITQKDCSSLSIQIWTIDPAGKAIKSDSQLTTFWADGKEAIFTETEFRYLLPYRFASAETGSKCLNPGWSYSFTSAGDLFLSMKYGCEDGKKGDWSERLHKISL